MTSWFVFAAAIAAAVAPFPVTAIEVVSGLEVHGYGDAGLERQSLSPQSRTTTEHGLSLLGTAQVVDRGRVWAQLTHLSSTRKVRLDLLFLDAEIDPQTTVRIGQARLPTGIYNETRDVQWLRASASLPLLYAGDPVALDKALRGVTLDHRFDSTALGEFQLEAFSGWGLVPHDDDPERVNLVGGRLSWTTPVTGLALKLSAYTGRSKEVTGPSGDTREQALVGSARYDRGPWTLIAEAANSRAEGQVYRARYIELDRQLTPAWRGFVRAETVHARSPDDGEDGPRKRRRAALGLAWNAEHWGVRLEAAANAGRLADLPADVDPQTVRSHWNDYRASVNYIF